MERDKGERGSGVQNIKYQQVNLNKGYAESYLTLFLKGPKNNPLWSSMSVAG